MDAWMIPLTYAYLSTLKYDDVENTGSTQSPPNAQCSAEVVTIANRRR